MAPPVFWPYFNQEGQIMPTKLLLVSPDFQTFLRPWIQKFSVWSTYHVHLWRKGDLLRKCIFFRLISSHPLDCRLHLKWSESKNVKDLTWILKNLKKLLKTFWFSFISKILNFQTKIMGWNTCMDNLYIGVVVMIWWYPGFEVICNGSSKQST